MGRCERQKSKGLVASVRLRSDCPWILYGCANLAAVNETYRAQFLCWHSLLRYVRPEQFRRFPSTLRSHRPPHLALVAYDAAVGITAGSYGFRPARGRVGFRRNLATDTRVAPTRDRRKPPFIPRTGCRTLETRIRIRLET